MPRNYMMSTPEYADFYDKQFADHEDNDEYDEYEEDEEVEMWEEEES